MRSKYLIGREAAKATRVYNPFAQTSNVNPDFYEEVTAPLAPVAGPAISEWDPITGWWGVVKRDFNYATDPAEKDVRHFNVNQKQAIRNYRNTQFLQGSKGLGSIPIIGDIVGMFTDVVADCESSCWLSHLFDADKRNDCIYNCGVLENPAPVNYITESAPDYSMYYLLGLGAVAYFLFKK